MNLKILPIVLILIIILLSGCTQEQNQPNEAQNLKCNSSCDDKNPCTEDICSEQTNFKCEHKEIIPCCGNNKCEQGENYLNCEDCAEIKTTTDLSKLAFDLKDLPDDYEIKEKRIVSKSEVNMSEALNISKELMEWDEGYIASFIKKDTFKAIGQRIYIYPSVESIANMDFSQGIFLIEENPLNSYEKIPCDIGDKCVSWKITFPIEGKSEELTTHMLYFAKMNIYEDIFVFDLDYELLIELAKIAEAKIK